MRFLILLVSVVSFATLAPSQELQTWLSKQGHRTKAVFFRLDESKGTLTLLIPREVRLSDLAPSSIDLARKLAKDQSLRRGTIGQTPNADRDSGNERDSASTPTDTFLFTKRFTVGVEDFEWFHPSVVFPSDFAGIEKMKRRYGVVPLRSGSRVQVVDKKQHPEGGMWIYHVKLKGKLYWVSEDSLSSKP